MQKTAEVLCFKLIQWRFSLYSLWSRKRHTLAFCKQVSLQGCYLERQQHSKRQQRPSCQQDKWQPAAWMPQDSSTLVPSGKLGPRMMLSLPNNSWNPAHFWFCSEQVGLIETSTLMIQLDANALGWPAPIPLSSPPFLCQMLLPPQPYQFILDWDRYSVMLECIPSACKVKRLKPLFKNLI